MRLRKMWHTDVPSIQGPWTPFMLRRPDNNLVTYPNEELSRPLDVQQSATVKLLNLFEEQQKDLDVIKTGPNSTETDQATKGRE